MELRLVQGALAGGLRRSR